MSWFNKKVLAISVLCVGMVVAQSFSYRDDKTVTRRNLRVIPRNVSDEELIDIMRHINKALGVNCSYCHQAIPGKMTAEGHQAHDFASDAKPAKEIARKMMRMTKELNERLDDMGDGQFERVACATCHRGHTQPSFTLDTTLRLQKR